MGGISSTVTMDYQKRVFLRFISDRSRNLFSKSYIDWFFDEIFPFTERLFSKEEIVFFFYLCYGKLSLSLSLYRIIFFFSFNFFS